MTPQTRTYHKKLPNDTRYTSKRRVFTCKHWGNKDRCIPCRHRWRQSHHTPEEHRIDRLECCRVLQLCLYWKLFIKLIVSKILLAFCHDQFITRLLNTSNSSYKLFSNSHNQIQCSGNYQTMQIYPPYYYQFIEVIASFNSNACLVSIVYIKWLGIFDLV